jgi:hypothetical protein
MCPQLPAQAGDVALADRLEDAAVPVGRVHQADALAVDLGPHHRAHLAVEHGPQVLQPAAAGDVDEQLVEARVARDQGVHVVGPGRDRHVLHRHPQVPGQVLPVRPEAAVEAGVLQHVPGEAHVLGVLLGHPGDHAVAAGHDRDQALGLQAAHGVPDRPPADPELGGQVRLDQAGLGGQLVVQDAVPQRPAHRLRK